MYSSQCTARASSPADTPTEPTAEEKVATALGEALGDNATVSGTTVTLTDDVNIAADNPISVDAGVTLVVPDGKTFTVEGSNALNVAENAEITVKSGGVLFLDSTSLEQGETNGTLSATITIKSGGKTYSTGTFGGTGYTVIEAGAEAYAGQDPDDEDPATIGGTDATLNLISGTFALNKSGYILNGNATITKNFGLTGGISLLIKAGKKLTIDIDAAISGENWPALWVLNSGTEITGESGAVIEVKTPTGDNKFGKIVFEMNSQPTPTVNFYDSEGAVIPTVNNNTEQPPQQPSRSPLRHL